jgi:hypothetical protein
VLEIILAFTGHFLPGDYNEIHPGIRYEQGSFSGAFFMNSEGNASLALGFYEELEINSDVLLFAEIGGASGYSGAKVVPFARAGIEFNETIRLFIAPSVNTNGDVGAVLGVETVLMRF